MIDEKKLHEIASDVADKLIESGSLHGRLLRCESPIERMMCVALMMSTALTFRFVNLAIYEQFEIGDYRVDFLVEAGLENGRTTRVVVECDGHEFHEKTKEQAARDKSRDRELTSLGFKVLRFTGSEIWRCAAQCAGEVIELIVDDHVDAMFQAHQMAAP